MRKWAGESAEAQFLAKATELGFRVACPWGDSGRYDFIVDGGGRLWRVQVKSTGCACAYRYAIAAHGSNPGEAYTAEEIDVLVAYVAPERAWYVIPVAALAGRRHLWLYPGRRESVGQFEMYREAWGVMGER